MNIQKYIKECYEIAQSKGFYPEDSKIEDHLMGIVSEIGEAYEAHRGGKFANWQEYDRIIEYYPQDIEHCKITYRDYISGTFEDELADVFIRLFNLMAHYEISERDEWFQYGMNEIDPLENIDVAHDLMDITERALKIRRVRETKNKKPVMSAEIGRTFKWLYILCIALNIPIEKHIQAKIEYNKTREHLHGKEY